MALGVKTKKGLEQGDIIQATGKVEIYQKGPESAVQYDNAIMGDRLGYATGQTVKIGKGSYIEMVLINRVLESQSPDFSTPKFYIASNAMVSFKANPDYNYLSSGPAVNTNLWSQILSGVSAILGVFGKSGNSESTTTDSADSLPSTSNNTTAGQQSWIQKNSLLVGSVVVMAFTGIIIYFVVKKK